MWLEFITAPVNIQLSNAASISHQTRNRLLPLGYSPLANSLPMCIKHRSNCDFASAILTTADCLCPTVRTLGTTKFFELFDVLVTLLQPRETLHQSSDLAALLQQFAFHSLVVFHVFFFFRSHRTLTQSTCMWLIHTRCSTTLHLECQYLSSNLLELWYYIRLLILYRGSIIDYAYTYHTSHETLF